MESCTPPTDVLYRYIDKRYPYIFELNDHFEVKYLEKKKENVQLLILIPASIKKQYQEVLDKRKIGLGERIRWLILDDLSRLLLYEEEMTKLEEWKKQFKKE